MILPFWLIGASEVLDVRYIPVTRRDSKDQEGRISFGDIRVPNVEQDYILLLGIVFYIKNEILLGSTTKKTLLKSPCFGAHAR